MTELIDAVGKVLQKGGLWVGIALSLGLAAGSIALAVAIVVRWPADHFSHHRVRPPVADQHVVARTAALIGKNVLGGLVILLGLVMALPGVPGQGLLTMIVGVTILDFPGKQRLERKLIGRPRILRSINRLRARFDRPPLVMD